MKFKISILFLLMTVLSFSAVSTYASEIKATTNTAPVNTKETPSESFLKKEKQSVAASIGYSPLVNAERNLSGASPFGINAAWENPFLPAKGGEEWQGGNVGGPIGDATLPMVVSLLILYLIFRTVSTSRRKNNL